MKPVKLFYLKTCPFCKKALRYIEEAKAANASIASFRACFKYGNPNTIVKTAVAMLGYNVGKCRAPFNQVPEEGIKALEKVLKENAEKGMC